MKESLSLQQARKLVLLSQGLPPAKQSGTALSATMDAFDRLGYIQIDTISAVQRAHHHTLWNRNPRYKNDHIDQLLEKKKIFEYWSHAAAYLPMRDYRYSLVRMKAIREGDQDHWYDRDPKMMKAVLKRIADEGPLMSKDFDGEKKYRGEWAYKPAKRALEYLFMQGELMIPKRVRFQKVYDLTERVLPRGVDNSLPTEEEYARHLITQFLRSNGLGRPEEMIYLRKNTKKSLSLAINEMLLNTELLEIDVAGSKYFALQDAVDLLDKPLSRSKLKILSPFDNLLIQRKRMQDIFGFDYQIECYVPEPKRKYGYFSLPVLWDGKLVARMDCKADRKTRILHIRHLVLEPGLKKMESFALALSKELSHFMAFNECEKIELHKVSPQRYQEIIHKTAILILN